MSSTDYLPCDGFFKAMFVGLKLAGHVEGVGFGGAGNVVYSVILAL